MTGVPAARKALAAGSKSFALAGKLLPRDCRDDAAVLYAWCRRCDDAIDLAPEPSRSVALVRMRRELDAVYGGEALDDPGLAAFAEVVRRRGIPRRCPQGLLDGFAMDVDRVRYDSTFMLVGYAYRVAGTVGEMMAHLMGATGADALRRAAHLGIAMQLTNVCRDVEEDRRNGRTYLPADLLDPSAGGEGTKRALRGLLAEADRFYASGMAGLSALSFRCAAAVRAAALIYADIGRLIAAAGHDPSRGRAVVPWRRKLWLVVRAFATEIGLRMRRSPGVLPAPRTEA